MLVTKSGPVYEPTIIETHGIYNWLKKHQSTLDGSKAYEEMKEVYEMLEFDFGQEKKHVG